jgi:hypothetical protein
MAIRSLKSGTFSRSGMVGNPVIMPGSYESIATTTLTTATSSITFSSIPSTYTHLQIRFSARSSVRERIDLTFNSDTGSTQYSAHRLYGFFDGSVMSTASEARIDRAAIWLMSGSGVPTSTSVFAGGVLDVLDYCNTNKYKTTRTLAGYDDNGTLGQFITLDSGFWKSTSAITSLTMTMASGSFQQYSSFALYGVN